MFDGSEDEINHWVHMECQNAEPFVIAMCQAVLDREHDVLPADVTVPPCSTCVELTLMKVGCPRCGG